MSRSWPEILRSYGDRRPQSPDAQFYEAFGAVQNLIGYISAGPLAESLFGWTSMFDLCIQQVNVEPFSGPFLKVSPQDDGTVEFRYCDTAIASRQWSRVAPAEGVVARFEAFLAQLRWIAS
jgi:hypothetical protein